MQLGLRRPQLPYNVLRHAAPRSTCDDTVYLTVSAARGAVSLGFAFVRSDLAERPALAHVVRERDVSVRVMLLRKVHGIVVQDGLRADGIPGQPGGLVEEPQDVVEPRGRLAVGLEERADPTRTHEGSLRAKRAKQPKAARRAESGGATNALHDGARVVQRIVRQAFLIQLERIETFPARFIPHAGMDGMKPKVTPSKAVEQRLNARLDAEVLLGVSERECPPVDSVDRDTEARRFLLGQLRDIVSEPARAVLFQSQVLVRQETPECLQLQRIHHMCSFILHS